jgi:hypothetical protein
MLKMVVDNATRRGWCGAAAVRGWLCSTEPGRGVSGTSVRRRLFNLAERRAEVMEKPSAAGDTRMRVHGIGGRSTEGTIPASRA